ncbi:MarR family transcriptional regulator [Streptomyces sp. RS10V-4]|uniref:MarR family winged helix-turn-helix transcriptional regulator n=1 Tax=Streptomyces rhizoryzae TaxID=2932493 RepID=UPI0020030178|nr:MarR family transcriptional regulator [Streptomyces rhizoryzae]MCK7621842.1 MarR family transcriptional regulator [Streptomyces rhizoryzae]
MIEREGKSPDVADADAVTRAVLTASRVLVGISARSLAAAEDKVTLAQFRLLVALSAHGDTRLSGVAEILGVNPSTAMRMIDRLTAAGLTERQPNPANRRESLIHLTEDGHRIVDEVTTRRRADIAAIVSRMDPDQGQALVDALTAFAQAADEPAAPSTGPDAYPLGWADSTTR